MLRVYFDLSTDMNAANLYTAVDSVNQAADVDMNSINSMNSKKVVQTAR